MLRLIHFAVECRSCLSTHSTLESDVDLLNCYVPARILRTSAREFGNDFIPVVENSQIVYQPFSLQQLKLLSWTANLQLPRGESWQATKFSSDECFFNSTKSNEIAFLLCLLLKKTAHSECKLKCDERNTAVLPIDIGILITIYMSI